MPSSRCHKAWSQDSPLSCSDSCLLLTSVLTSPRFPYLSSCMSCDFSVGYLYFWPIGYCLKMLLVFLNGLLIAIPSAGSNSPSSLLSCLVEISFPTVGSVQSVSAMALPSLIQPTSTELLWAGPGLASGTWR